jgi:hypothetical protein
MSGQDDFKRWLSARLDRLEEKIDKADDSLTHFKIEQAKEAAGPTAKKALEKAEKAHEAAIKATSPLRSLGTVGAGGGAGIAFHKLLAWLHLTGS